ncbi:hypothetical protein CASFOL_019723 [Castilleja foliolosa]|uniref:Uncharacterized protein n=1 Tax=Castilleja foliolosa TaxID=1961234 RepID=A0ABD3D0V4_9LAMI
MSNKHQSKADDGSGDAGDEEGEGPTNSKEKKCPGCGQKARRFSCIRLRKRKQRGINVNPGCWGRKVVACACLKQPLTLDSSGESPTSDPNSPEFTFDMLRALIEKNDFYSKECSPHLDEDTLVNQNT